MITESRIKSGTLTFTVDAAPVEFSCQHSNVRVTPSSETDGDATEMLCGDILPPERTRTDTLNIASVQDFTDPSGFQSFSWEHDGEALPFTWEPLGATGPTFTGTVTVEALEVGGDVNKRLTVDAEWEGVGAFVWTPAV